MKKYLFFLGLFLALTQKANATFVQGGTSNFATAASTACATGTVTSGNVEIMAVQSNSTTRVTISSTRVTAWKQAQANVNASSIYLWYGAITSSGAETVTVSLTTGTAVIGSACLEYSGTINRDASTSIFGSALSLTTVAASTTVIEVGTGSPINATSPFTSRAQVTQAGTSFFTVGDVNESSQGTYSAAFTGGTPIGIQMLSISAAASPPTTFVQAGVGNGGNSASQTCVYPANVASGDLLVVGAKNNGGVSVSTIVDTLSTSWTTDINNASGAGSMFHGTAASSGAETVTITWGSPNIGAVVCSEYFAVVNLNVFNNTPTSSSVSVTTTKPVTTLVYVVGDGASFRMSDPFTPRVTVAQQSTPVGLLIIGDVNETSTGTYTASSTTGGSGTNALGAFYSSASTNVQRHR